MTIADIFKHNNIFEFEELVQPLHRFELRRLGLKPLTETGLFPYPMGDQLIKFCKENPQYHIATILMSNVYVNRHLPDAMFYMICEGNRNPEIIGYQKRTWRRHVWLKLHWFDTDQD